MATKGNPPKIPPPQGCGEFYPPQFLNEDGLPTRRKRWGISQAKIIGGVL